MGKEQHSYLCRDVVEEYQSFDRQPERKFKTLSGCYQKTNQNWAIRIGYERFLAPEIFFNPEIFASNVTTTLPQTVENCINQCPMDYRRKLYANVVLAGGSTTFTHFKERLQHDLQVCVDKRLTQSQKTTGAASQPIPVVVHGGK